VATEHLKRALGIGGSRLYGVRELVAVVKIVADEKIFESERLAAGIKRQSDGSYTGEIALLPGLAVDREGLGDVLRDVIDTLDLLSPIKVINAYLLTRAVHETDFQARAAWNFRKMVANMVPDMECRVRVVRFADKDRTLLKEIAPLAG
jgi:hypothetical protein